MEKKAILRGVVILGEPHLPSFYLVRRALSSFQQADEIDVGFSVEATLTLLTPFALFATCVDPIG